MKYKVTVDVGRRFEFDDIDADNESDARLEAEGRVEYICSNPGEVYIRQTNVEEIEAS